MRITAPEGPIQPNATGKLNVEIATLFRKGNYRKEIGITTNDPDRKEVTFVVAANIIETLSIHPAYLNFGQVRPGEKPIREITLLNPGKEKVVITKVVIDPANALTFSGRSKITLKPGEPRQFTVGLNPDKFKGEGSITFVITKPIALEKRLSITIDPSPVP